MKNTKFTFDLDGSNYAVTGISENIFRCTYSKKEINSTLSPLEIEAVAKEKLEVNETPKSIHITSAKINLEISKADGNFVWKNQQTGELLLQEGEKELTESPYETYQIYGDEPVINRVKTVDGERNFIDNLKPKMDHMGYRGRLNFTWQKDEHIHGLGQGEEGIYNYRGHTQYMYQHNMRTPMPFFISNKGYGILIDCGSLMTFNDDERGSYLYLDMIEQLDYYFIMGPDLDTIIAGHRQLTGRAVMLPRWAFGYIQSKEAYHNQKEFIGIGAEYRKRNIPLDGLVQDWNTWEEGKWGNKLVDKQRYPDLVSMNKDLHDMNIHTMISIWPNINAGTEDYMQMESANYLLKDYATYDAFNEEARALYWKQANQELFSSGFDAWWCDSTEPFSGPDWNGEYMREPWERYLLVGNEHKKFLNPDRANLYGLFHAKGIYENQRKTCPAKRVLNLTRSSYAGSQKYGTVLWSGDTAATWETFRRQVVEGLNMSLSGIPYCTSDIGAFFTVNKNWRHRGCSRENDPTPKWFWKGDYEEGVDDVGYKELYIRWFQYSAFVPMFRSHGTDTPREVWNFGQPGDIFYDTLVQTIELRYQLLPYIYSWAAKVYFEDSTMMRSLLFDYPQDQRAASESHQFMLGDALLICPITTTSYDGTTIDSIIRKVFRKCYLPAGNVWYDFQTGKKYEGGQEIEVLTGLERIPVFVKAGSIIPQEKELQHSGQKSDFPFEIHIYSGCNGKFSLYEDDGDGYEYETGKYNRINLEWDDQNREFTMSNAVYEFNQSIRGRDCRIFIDGKLESEFAYTGEAIKLRFD